MKWIGYGGGVIVWVIVNNIVKIFYGDGWKESYRGDYFVYKCESLCYIFDIDRIL